MAHSSNIPDPSGIFYPKWGLDKYFFGSWANLPIGISSDDYVSLWRSVEGYAHGGYLTGVDQAEKIAQVQC